MAASPRARAWVTTTAVVSIRAGAVASLLVALELTSRLAAHPLPTAPLAASLALAATAPALPAARPRNITRGHLLAALLGAASAAVIADMTAAVAVGAGLAVAGLAVLRTPQPPAIATACVAAAAHASGRVVLSFLCFQVAPLGLAALGIELAGGIAARRRRLRRTPRSP
jgi:CBS-domain-containing membrane protein